MAMAGAMPIVVTMIVNCVFVIAVVITMVFVRSVQPLREWVWPRLPGAFACRHFGIRQHALVKPVEEAGCIEVNADETQSLTTIAERFRPFVPDLVGGSRTVGELISDCCPPFAHRGRLPLRSGNV